MYPRILQNLLKASTKVNNRRTLKTLVFSTVVLSTQKKLPFVVAPHFCERYFSSDKNSENEHEVLPRDPTERKRYIDDKAQKQIDELLKNNPEMEKFMKVLELEISVRREDGERVPAGIRPRDWVELLKLKGSFQRKKYLNYLFVVEKKEEKEKALQMERNLQLEQIREDRKNQDQETEGLVYGIAHNSLFRRIQDTTMSKMWNWNALHGTMFGNKIVFDFSFEKQMNYREIKSCAKQILESHAINRQHNFPFDIYLCNVNFNGELIERLNRFLPTLFDDDFPFHITSKSYLELFDKSSLAYLSSDAPKELTTYDPDKVYIIGALVDRGEKQSVSLAQAKREDLQMYKLPLDTYTKFGHGSGKDLTLNQVFAIMLDAQDNNWQKAMEHVPRRKLYESRIRALEKKVQNEIYFSKSQAIGDNSIQKKLNFEHDVPKFTSVSQLILNNKSKYMNENKYRKQEPKFQSSSVNDFSNSARAKLKKQWSE